MHEAIFGASHGLTPVNSSTTISHGRTSLALMSVNSDTSEDGLARNVAPIKRLRPDQASAKPSKGRQRSTTCDPFGTVFLTILRANLYM